jgi:predicted methyltransferase
MAYLGGWIFTFKTGKTLQALPVNPAQEILPMRHALLVSALSFAALTAACAPQAATPVEPPAPAATTLTEAAPVAAAPAGPAVGSLAWAVAGDWRTAEEKARDTWRNPEATLAFFGVEADDKVVEIWPGGGWYTQILAPYLKSGGGRYVAAAFDPVGNEFRANAVQRFRDTYMAKPELYGDIALTVFAQNAGPITEPGTADVVLTFRNVHNWMGGGWAEKAFKDAYDALKPGGVLGVVEHRLPSAMTQEPTAPSGYVHEDYVIALATEAGFVLEARSEINANPKDTADHPFGVWTLPPNSRTKDRDGNAPEGFNPETYKAIGESDRMTLKFRKPAN